MKKVQVIPVATSHQGRGVGYYATRLLPKLSQYASDFNITIGNVGPIDLVHYLSFDLFLPTLPFKKPISTIVTIHDVTPLEFPNNYPPGVKGRINLFKQWISLFNVKTVITDSYASVASIKKHLHLPDRKIKIVHLAADSLFSPIDNSEKLCSVMNKYQLPKKFVLYAGDLNYNKNIPSLMNVCKTLNIPLVLVGKRFSQVPDLDLNHPELTHLKSIYHHFTQPGQNPWLHVLGFIPDEDLAAVYNCATVYCQPSFAEGFGLPVLEAMACGIPVLSSSAPALVEISGGHAQYFDPHSISDFTTCLEKIWGDAHLREKLSQEGFIHVKNFSWDKTAQETLMVYQQVLK